MAKCESIILNSGFQMPLVGLGTWQSVGNEVETAVDYAISIGYRHIDTAFFYQNEDVIGRVLKKYLDSGEIKREELFIVTKLPFFGNRPSEVEKYMNLSLEKLQLSYVDLYLMHMPFTTILKDDGKSFEMDHSTDLIGIWKEMEKLMDSGKARSIGVSNFNAEQVERILANAKIPPATNQVEMHAYLQQPELVTFLKSKNIVVTAYSPLGTGLHAVKFFKEAGHEMVLPNIIKDPVVMEIAKKYNKSPAQILLKHLVQKDIVVIPKSVNPNRIKENIDLFDFQLNPSDVKKLNALDANLRLFHFRNFIPGIENHPEYPFKS